MLDTPLAHAHPKRKRSARSRYDAAIRSKNAHAFPIRWCSLAADLHAAAMLAQSAQLCTALTDRAVDCSRRAARIEAGRRQTIAVLPPAPRYSRKFDDVLDPEDAADRNFLLSVSV